jgi:N-acylglucosamine 2-epimerase
MKKEKIGELRAFYRHHLLEDLVPFWESRTRDDDYGGYLHCFDRAGKITGTDKYMWCQGRQLWMFSALYNCVEKRRSWLDLAKHGRDFVLKHGYAGNGSWCYQLDRSGSVIKSDASFFTDSFVLTGLAEYAKASGSDEDMDLINEAFSRLEGNLEQEGYNEFHHFSLDPRYKWHSAYMIMIFVCGVLEPILGSQRTEGIIQTCLDQILYVFAKDEHQALFETINRDGTFADDPQGRLINPGHALESMWFCMEEGRRRNDRTIIDRCIEIAEWTMTKGYDQEYGGILNTIDCGGGPPELMQTERKFGESWTTKVWWVHSEALYTLLLSAVESKQDKFFDMFLDIHEWCREYFHDPEHGEWYKYLYQDGRPKVTDKGTWVKSAFHIPRNIMQVVLLLDEMDSA